MKEITLLEPFAGFKKGAVLNVVFPREPMGDRGVDAVRAVSMIEKGLAKEGRQKRGIGSNTKRDDPDR